MIKILMHKDNVVAKFDCTNFYIKNIEIENEYLMPFIITEDYKKNNAIFLDWKKSRPRPILPQNFTNSLLSQIGETYEEISDFICASLTDCYWFKPENIFIQWKDINYFDNKIIEKEINSITLSDRMYKYTDYTDELEAMLKQGKVKKFIKYFTIDKEDNYCIVKTCDILNRGQDVFNELIGNVLEDALDIDGAQYYILANNIIYENINCNVPLATCELCIQNDSEEIVQINNLINTTELNNTNLYEYLVSLGFKEDIDKMIVLDYLMLNPDRDLSNIAIIRDSETLIYKRMAPIYDLGASFNYYGPDKTVRMEFEDYSMPFMRRHSRQILLVDDFSFVDFDMLYESIDIIDALISYSALTNKEKDFIIKTIKERIDSLKEIVNNNKKDNSIRIVRSAEKINKRFNVEKIIEATGIDPIITQNPNDLFINYLSDEGKKEFDKFDINNPNLKERFDNFKKDTLLF